MFKLSERNKKILSTEVDFSFSRSSGPGGQKVNKTETRVELHWNLELSHTFNEAQKQRIRTKLKNRLSKEGLLLFYSDQYRTRLQNKNYCFENLIESLEKALTIPKARRKTKPTRSSVEKRIQEKKKHGEKKRQRKKWD